MRLAARVMKKTSVRSVVCLLAAGVPMAAQMPAYQPEVVVAQPQILHSWGTPEMGPLLLAWETEFMRSQPNIRFVDTLKGTETAQAALFTHVAEFAAMGRPILPLERHVMFRREHHLPLEIVVATGAADREDRDFALAVVVSKDNPLRSLSVQQLDGIFGDRRTGAWDEAFLWHPEAARGAEKNIRTWGQLGLTGEWADKPIHVYGYPVTIYSPTSGPMFSFRKAVMQGGDVWNPDLQEYADPLLQAAALGRDKYGIGYMCACAAGAALKTLALTPLAGGAPVALSSRSVQDGSYPLGRRVYLYIDHVPGEPMDAGVKEFLMYVLSREGQQAVTRGSGYLPLTPEMAEEQRRKLP